MNVVSIGNNAMKAVREVVDAENGLKPVDMFTGEKKSIKSLIERIEALEIEKQTIVEDINDLFQVAKSDGFHVNAIKTVLKLRKMDPEKLSTLDAAVAEYRRQLTL